MHSHESHIQNFSILMQLILVLPFFISLISYIVAVYYSNQHKKKLVSFTHSKLDNWAFMCHHHINRSICRANTHKFFSTYGWPLIAWDASSTINCSSGSSDFTFKNNSSKKRLVSFPIYCEILTLALSEIQS